MNGNFYIGVHSTNNLNDNYLGSGKRLKRSVEKHGKENFKFEVLEFFDDRSSLMLRENEIVNNYLLSDPNCMNLRVGGIGGFSHEQQLINSKRGNLKFVELMKNPEWRKSQCDKVSIAQKKRCLKYGGYWNGKKHLDETKKKIGSTNSLKQMGENNSQYNTCWITNDVENMKINKNENLPNGWKYGRIIKGKT